MSRQSNRKEKEKQKQIAEAADAGSPFLDSSHPLLQRVQDALTKQLEAVKSKVVLETREKEEALRKAVKSREDTGVELYNIQQELAKLQQYVTDAQSEHTRVQQQRQQAEIVLAEVKVAHQRQLDEINGQKSKHSEYQKELDKLNSTINQVESHYRELLSQVAVSKREAFKTEEDITRLEREKQSQDLLIDKLNEQIKQLEDKIALTLAQLDAQKQETAFAGKTLSEAGSEMEKIHLEKKQLLVQWKSCLINVSQRDEGLAGLEREVQKQREELLALDSEIGNYKKAIQNEQNNNETLTGILNKVTTEISFLEKQIEKYRERKEALIAEFNQYQKTLDATEAELVRVTQESRGLEDQVNHLQRDHDVIVNETVKVEDQIYRNLQLQKTLEKGASSTEQGAAKLTLTVRDKEMQISLLQNELARIRVDLQNVISQNYSLADTMQSLSKGLMEKDKLVERYEVEIRRRNDEIERKQTEVDRLNKKYDTLLSNLKDENMGPLEATVHNLTNEISKRQRDCAELQYYWLRSQTELVNLNKEIERQSEVTSDMERQLTVLHQKQLRIQGSFDANEKEIRETELSIKNLQIDMQKLNGLIVKNTRLQSALAEGNLGLENEFYSQLKSAEEEAIMLEERISRIKEEKENLVHDIIESERLVMLWEKKIQLAKETAEALNPNIGAAETKALGKEIQRLKAQLVQMRKQQELLILELERAVGRRESVALRSRDLEKKTATAKNIEQKRATELGKKLKDAKQELENAKNNIRAMKATKAQLESEYENQLQQSDAVKAREKSLKRELDDYALNKQRQFDSLTILQKIYKKYETIEREDMPENREATVTKEMARQSEKRTRIDDLLSQLKTEFPQFRDQFEMIRNVKIPV